MAVALLAVTCLTTWIRFHLPSAARLEIVEPRDGQEVSQQATVRLQLREGDAAPWIILHGQGADSFWVQPQPNRVGPGAWEGQVYVGAASSDSGGGQYFEIRAVAGAEQALHEGLVLGSWPAAETQSAIVTVRR